MKLFNTGSNAVINECMYAFQDKKMSDCVIARKFVFLNRYCKSDNIVCKALSGMARKELLAIGRM